MTIWVDAAFKHIGTREIRGIKHNAKIVGWWKDIGAIFRDDETPWCAAFVGGVLETVGIKSTRKASARSYLNWGYKVDDPMYGAIVVFWRGSPNGWSGHVGFVVGIDQDGKLVVLGGNQEDEVNLRSFTLDPKKTRVLGYRYPAGRSLDYRRLPLYNGLKLSQSEA